MPLYFCKIRWLVHFDAMEWHENELASNFSKLEWHISNLHVCTQMFNLLTRLSLLYSKKMLQLDLYRCLSICWCSIAWSQVQVQGGGLH
jgi:hypothetical protein